MELILLSLLLLMMSLVHSRLLEVVPTLTVQPNWTEIFIGETVTLTCELPAETGTEWMYMWYRNEQEMHSSTENYYVIKEIKEHQKHLCMSYNTSGERQTPWSNEVTLTVRGTPTPELTSSLKGAALLGSPVTLHCKLEQPAGWSFYWSRHTQNPEHETNTATSSYTISSVAPSDGGQYLCRAGRGNPVYYTHYSDALWVNVTVTEAQFSILRPLSSVLAVTPYLLATIVLGVKCFRARAQTGKNQSQFAVIEE